MEHRHRPAWFDPRSSEEDDFLAPNFDLGQLFFTAETARRLTGALDGYTNPCCLCTPRLAYEWQKQGRLVRLLDWDVRFESIGNFQQFDLTDPKPLAEEFDVVVADPVFVRAPIIAHAVRTLISPSSDSALYTTFPVARHVELQAAFAGFGLRLLDFPVRWCNVRPDFQVRFGLFGPEPLSEPEAVS